MAWKDERRSFPLAVSWKRPNVSGAGASQLASDVERDQGCYRLANGGGQGNTAAEKSFQASEVRHTPQNTTHVEPRVLRLNGNAEREVECSGKLGRGKA